MSNFKVIQNGVVKDLVDEVLPKYPADNVYDYIPDISPLYIPRCTPEDPWVEKKLFSDYLDSLYVSKLDFTIDLPSTKPSFRKLLYTVAGESLSSAEELYGKNALAYIWRTTNSLNIRYGYYDKDTQTMPSTWETKIFYADSTDSDGELYFINKVLPTRLIFIVQGAGASGGRGSASGIPGYGGGGGGAWVGIINIPIIEEPVNNNFTNVEIIKVDIAGSTPYKNPKTYTSGGFSGKQSVLQYFLEDNTKAFEVIANGGEKGTRVAGTSYDWTGGPGGTVTINLNNNIDTSKLVWSRATIKGGDGGGFLGYGDGRSEYVHCKNGQAIDSYVYATNRVNYQVPSSLYTLYKHTDETWGYVDADGAVCPLCGQVIHQGGGGGSSFLGGGGCGRSSRNGHGYGAGGGGCAGKTNTGGYNISRSAGLGAPGALQIYF